MCSSARPYVQGNIFNFHCDTVYRIVNLNLFAFRIIKPLLFLTLVTTLGVITACGSKSTSTPTPTRGLTQAPSITIVEPQNGSILSSGKVTVNVTTSNITLIDVMGVSNVPGQAHIHYYMDVDPPTTPYQPTDTAPGTYAMTAATNYTWHNVAVGQHKFAVELVNNNDTPLIPPVTAVVEITMQAGTPLPSPTVTVPSGPSVVINLVAQNMVFDKKTITVPADANVTINFDNKDKGVLHNFALYDSSAAKNALFVGQIILGQSITTYQFIAPKTAGTYYFRCDVHPTTMTGSFIVTASGY